MWRTRVIMHLRALFGAQRNWKVTQKVGVHRAAIFYV